jgi:hypothetical protein
MEGHRPLAAESVCLGLLERDFQAQAGAALQEQSVLGAYM